MNEQINFAQLLLVETALHFANGTKGQKLLETFNSGSWQLRDTSEVKQVQVRSAIDRAFSLERNPTLRLWDLTRISSALPSHRDADMCSQCNASWTTGNWARRQSENWLPINIIIKQGEGFSQLMKYSLAPLRMQVQPVINRAWLTS